MSYEIRTGGSPAVQGIDGGAPAGVTPGKRALTDGVAAEPSAGPVQRSASGEATEPVHAAAAHGIATPATAMPHGARIQALFGPRHDVSGIQAHVGPQASEAAGAMGASAYASGNHAVFAGTPDLHTAAHEAAHVVQQAHGVSLYGGVGQVGDTYERHADAVADRVVAGESAADLLDGVAGGAGGSAMGVQRRSLAEGLRSVLAPASATPAAPVQRALSATLRSSLEITGPVDYNAIVAMIHAAPTAERQAVVSDSALRDLINARMSPTAAQTVFSSLMEGSQTWRNPPSNDFYTYFVTNSGSGTVPNTSTMNCWESIIYAAYLAHQVSAAWIKTFYTTATSSPDPNAMIWQQLGFSTALPRYAPPTTSGTGGATSTPGLSTTATVTPRAGQLLFYHSGGAVPGHVAVSLGGDQAISLWNQPNNVDAVQRIQVTALAGTVYVGDPPW